MSAFDGLGFSLSQKPQRKYTPRKKASVESKIAKLEKEQRLTGYGTAETYRLTDEQMEHRERIYMGYTDYKAMRPDDNKFVGPGSWVTIIQAIPVNVDVRPMKWAVYWGVPCKDSKGNDGFDSSGRYKVDIIVKHALHEAYEPVSIFPHEYTIIPQEHLDHEVSIGSFVLQQLHYSTGQEMDIKLIEQGRSLVEEEREMIWALQLDGLTETQACNEYFYSRHTDKENHNIWYSPHPELAEQLENLFG